MAATLPLSCDRLYRTLVRAALSGDSAALLACSDYRIDRGYRPLGRAKREQRISGLAARRYVRHACGAARYIPVTVVDGSSAPTITGESYHYTTPSGSPVYYPSAYRRAYGRPVYHASTLSVEVGRGWLLQRGIDPESVHAD